MSHTLDKLTLSAIEDFRQHELGSLHLSTVKDLELAAVGTTAEKVINSEVLSSRLIESHVNLAKKQTFQDPADLIANSEWQLALVLSPFKQSVLDYCDRILPKAKQTGVVDTIVRSPSEVIGINTNSYAAAASIQSLTGKNDLTRVLIAGSGASSRSVLAGLVSYWPSLEVGVIGRTVNRVENLIEELKAGTSVKNAAEFQPDLIINTTTVGETSDDDEITFDLTEAMGPATYYFDLNNRLSQLQKDAVSKGCKVQSGVIMQHVTHALRTSLVTDGSSTNDDQQPLSALN